MILATTRSDWLKRYLKEQGGQLTVSWQLLVVN
jgi:hypothetical protein